MLSNQIITSNAMPADGIRVATADQKFALGTKLITYWGDIYRYAKAGATALAPGKATQSVAPTAHHTNIATGVAVAKGDTEFTYVTELSTATVADEYAGGLLVVNDATGEGHKYRIKSNTAGAKPTIVLEEPILVALAATSEVTLIRNRFAGSVIAPTTPTSTLNGIPQVDVPAANFYWSLMEGETPALTHGTVVVGNAVMVGGANGAVTPLGNDDPQLKQVGTVMVVAAATEYSTIAFRIV